MSKVFYFSILFFSSISFAFPLPKGPIQWKNIQFDINSQYDFEGIVALSNCSGSLIQLENSKPTDQALVLTNGHCLESGFTAPGKFIANKPSQKKFNVFNSQQVIMGSIQANLVVYSTMTGTDITIYRTKETYQDILQKWNIHPFTLSSNHPNINDSINIVSGYWRRGYSCHIEAFIHQLMEEGYTFTDSVRFDRPGCETIGGTSGSPIIRTGSREVIAINNTGNEDGEKCTMNNPCEVDVDGNISFTKGYSYGQQTYQIYSCLNAKNEIDVRTPGCLLVH